MKIKVICDGCGTEFERLRGEVTRSQKLGRKNWCTLKCFGNNNHSHLPKDGNLDNLVSTNRRDEYSDFRYHLNNIKRHCLENHDRKRKLIRECLITIQDLKIQWDKQDGKCPYTGWLLEVGHTDHIRNNHSPKRASVDRIDPSKGYTPDNIQFVCLIAQYAKNGWSSKELLDFCQAVVNNGVSYAPQNN